MTDVLYDGEIMCDLLHDARHDKTIVIPGFPINEDNIIHQSSPVEGKPFLKIFSENVSVLPMNTVLNYGNGPYNLVKDAFHGSHPPGFPMLLDGTLSTMERYLRSAPLGVGFDNTVGLYFNTIQAPSGPSTTFSLMYDKLLYEYFSPPEDTTDPFSTEDPRTIISAQVQVLNYFWQGLLEHINTKYCAADMIDHSRERYTKDQLENTMNQLKRIVFTGFNSTHTYYHKYATFTIQSDPAVTNPPPAIFLASQSVCAIEIIKCGKQAEPRNHKAHGHSATNGTYTDRNIQTFVDRINSLSPEGLPRALIWIMIKFIGDTGMKYMALLLQSINQQNKRPSCILTDERILPIRAVSAGVDAFALWKMFNVFKEPSFQIQMLPPGHVYVYQKSSEKKVWTDRLEYILDRKTIYDEANAFLGDVWNVKYTELVMTGSNFVAIYKYFKETQDTGESWTEAINRVLVANNLLIGDFNEITDRIIFCHDQLSWYISYKYLENGPLIDFVNKTMEQIIFILPNSMKNLQYLRRNGRPSCWTNFTDFLTHCWHDENLKVFYNSFSKIPNDSIETVIRFFDRFKIVYTNPYWLTSTGYSPYLQNTIQTSLYYYCMALKIFEDTETRVSISTSLYNRNTSASTKTVQLIQQLYDVIEDVQKIFIRNQNDFGGHSRLFEIPKSKRLKTGGGVKRKATTPLIMDLNELFKDVYTAREPEPIPSIPRYEYESFIPQIDDIYNEDRISEVDGQYIDILNGDTPIPLLTNKIINFNLMNIFSDKMFEWNSVLINSDYVNGTSFTPDYNGCATFYYILFKQHNLDDWINATLKDSIRGEIESFITNNPGISQLLMSALIINEHPQINERLMSLNELRSLVNSENIEYCMQNISDILNSLEEKIKTQPPIAYNLPAQQYIAYNLPAQNQRQLITGYGGKRRKHTKNKRKRKPKSKAKAKAKSKTKTKKKKTRKFHNSKKKKTHKIKS